MSRGASDKVDISVHATGPRKLLGIGIPSYGMTHLFFTARLLNLRLPMNRAVRWFFVIGKEVGQARNEICARALQVEEDDPREKVEELLFIDDDVLFHPDMLLKLFQHDLPIVSGLYYSKTSVPTPLVLHGEFEGTAKKWTPGELVECAAHGMGLCLMKTDLLKRLRDETDLGVDAGGFPAWFRTRRDEGIVRADGVSATYNATEDVYFLQQVRALGVQPVVDTSAQAFGWHLDTQKQIAYPAAQWDEFTKKGTITWPDTPVGPVVWTNAA